MYISNVLSLLVERAIHSPKSAAPAEFLLLVKKVPLLGDIPYLGVLFRSTSEFNEKKELLIFVTPKIQIE